jgi:hypothetical protein
MPFQSTFHSKQEALCQQPSKTQNENHIKRIITLDNTITEAKSLKTGSNILTLAAPVLLGMMLNEAALPPLQSLADGPSTVFWVAEWQISMKRMN